MTLAEMMEQRRALLAKMRAAHEGERAEEFAATETELRALDGRIEQRRTLDALDRAAPPPRDEQLSTELRSYSLSRALAWGAGLSGVDAGREREIDTELRRLPGRTFRGVAVPTEIFETRVLTTAAPVGGPGSNLVSTDLMTDAYFSALTASTVVSGLGARTLSGLVGNVEIPGEKAAPTVGWVAENAALSPSDPEFRQVPMSPKHVGGLSEFSRNMLLQSSPAIEMILRQMMARDIGLGIDRAAILGGGANQPVGVLAASGVQSQAYDTSLHFTAAEMVAKANIANVGPSRAFLSTHTIEKIALQSLDLNGRPHGVGEVFHNLPVRFSNQVPTNLGAGTNEHGLIYADWSELMIGIWSALDVLVNPYESTAYSKGNVSVRAMATVDIALRHPAAFVKATGVLATALAVVEPAEPVV